MLSKRIIACLDVRDGHLAKSVRFQNTRDIGDPIARASEYYDQGLDELVLYDITASSDNRGIMLDVVSRVAERVFIPFSVGGGIRSVKDARDVLLAGAEKVNINTAAVQNPHLISEISAAFGAQCAVLAMDVLQVEPSESIPSGYEIVIHGGRTRTGKDAVKWAQEGEQLGAGELVVNSIDADGVRQGYEIPLTRRIADTVCIPVIASGGAGKPEHLYDVLTEGHADGALVASIVHYGDYTIGDLKEYLIEKGLSIRRA